MLRCSYCSSTAGVHTHHQTVSSSNGLCLPCTARTGQATEHAAAWLAAPNGQLQHARPRSRQHAVLVRSAYTAGRPARCCGSSKCVGGKCQVSAPAGTHKRIHLQVAEPVLGLGVQVCVHPPASPTVMVDSASGRMSTSGMCCWRVLLRCAAPAAV